jgi:hypothetical protein
MSKFVLLKQSFPKSRKERKCDAYNIIINQTSLEERKNLGVNDNNLTKIIYPKEQYIYRVGKEDGKFKALHISIKNFEIIRKYLSHIFIE